MVVRVRPLPLFSVLGLRSLTSTVPIMPTLRVLYYLSLRSLCITLTPMLGVSLNTVSSVEMKIEEAITLAMNPGPEPVDVISFSCGIYNATTPTYVNVTIDALRKFLGLRGFE